MAGWDDVPHLDDETKKDLYGSIPPYQREARSQGVPQLGAGAIYPVPESEITCEPFPIPRFWPRAYALDVGWKRTAAIWGARNPEDDVWYLWSEHYRAEAEPSIHAAAIRGRGAWIAGVIDPAARGRSQVDGSQLILDYQNLGLNLVAADNAVEAGIFQCWERMVEGKLFVFKTCVNFFREFRIYRRDEKGKIVKENDHLMDCMRYLIVSGVNVATTEPKPPDEWEEQFADTTRNPNTGY